MTTSDHSSIVIGIFHDSSAAEHALDDLRIAGLDEATFGLAVPTGGADGHGVSTGIVADGFAHLGIAVEQQARCEGELRSGRSIVAVRRLAGEMGSGPAIDQVAEILHRNGADQVA